MDLNQRRAILNIMCSVCQEQQWNYSEMARHISASGHDSKCNVCKVSLRLTNIEWHLSKCSTKMTCGICKETLESNKFLSHKYSKHGTKPFYCPLECGAKYTSVTTYKRNKRKHLCRPAGRQRPRLRRASSGSSEETDSIEEMLFDNAEVPMSQSQSSSEESDNPDNIADGDASKQEEEEDELTSAWYAFFESLQVMGLTVLEVDYVAACMEKMHTTLRKALQNEVNNELYLMGVEYARAATLWLERTNVLQFPKELTTAYRRTKVAKRKRKGQVKGSLKTVPVETANRPGKQGPPGYAEQYNRPIGTMLFEVAL